MGVSDFLMMSLAKLTVAVGKEVKSAVAESEVSYTCKHTTHYMTVVEFFLLATTCNFLATDPV